MRRAIVSLEEMRDKTLAKEIRYLGVKIKYVFEGYWRNLVSKPN